MRHSAFAEENRAFEKSRNTLIFNSSTRIQYSLYSGIIISPWNCFDLLISLYFRCTLITYKSYISPTNIISHKPFKYKISAHILQSPQNPFTQFAPPLGYSWGQSAYPHFSKSYEKYKKTADFLRNQRLNMVAGTGLEPAASGLWEIGGGFLRKISSNSHHFSSI